MGNSLDELKAIFLDGSYLCQLNGTFLDLQMDVFLGDIRAKGIF